MTPGKGSKYREFYDLSGRITCMIEPCCLHYLNVMEYGIILIPTLITCKHNYMQTVKTGILEKQGWIHETSSDF